MKTSKSLLVALAFVVATGSAYCVVRAGVFPLRNSPIEAFYCRDRVLPVEADQDVLEPGLEVSEDEASDLFSPCGDVEALAAKESKKNELAYLHGLF